MAHPNKLDWSISVSSEEHELGGSYSVYFFLGRVHDSPERWTTSPSHIGTHTVFTSSRPPPDSDDEEIQSVIHLDGALRTRLPNSPHTPGIVLRHIRDNIKWRVQRVTGEVVRNKDLASLNVIVFSLKLKYNPEDGIYEPDGDPTEYPDCTRDKDGM